MPGWLARADGMRVDQAAGREADCWLGVWPEHPVVLRVKEWQRCARMQENREYGVFAVHAGQEAC